MTLPITQKQQADLRLMRRSHPVLAKLATAVAIAFEPSQIDNPEMARVILDVTCRRIIAGDQAAKDALIGHLEYFGKLNCLTPTQFTEFIQTIRELDQPSIISTG